jgi:hypothetical protein
VSDKMKSAAILRELSSRRFLGNLPSIADIRSDNICIPPTPSEKSPV